MVVKISSSILSKSINHDQELIRFQDYHSEPNYQILNESDQWMLRYRPEHFAQIRG